MQTYLHIYSKMKRLGRWKMPHTLGKKGDNRLLHSSSPPSQISIIGLRTKRIGRTAGEKNQGVRNLGGLKRKMLLGIFGTERGPLGPFSSTVFSSLLEWLDLGLGVSSAWEACLALENQEGPGWGPGKESQRQAALGQILG